MSKCGKNVYIYDPDRTRLEMAREKLEKICKPTVVGSPDDLIDKLMEHRPDVLVYVYSRVDEMELNKMGDILIKPQFSNLPILLITSLELQEKVVPYFVTTRLIIQNNPDEVDEGVARVAAIMEELNHIPQVMVLDDDDYLRSMEISLLEDMYNPIEARKGQDILDYLKSNELDCILLDLDCYDMDPIELVDKVKKTVNGAKVPIVFLTDCADVEVLNRCQDKSPAGYLMKPVKGEDLRNKIDEAIRKGPSLSDRKLVLVVDDDVMSLKNLQAILKNEYKVVAIPTADQAIKYFDTKIPDIVILDYEMPVKNGLYVLRYMRQKKEFNNVPVIMLTGNKEKTTVVSCIQAGAQGYLTKPINAMSLILRVRQLLGIVPKEIFDEAEFDA
ncbi:MAG: response regulator [Lachnospiraceae bacterium]|nr:response regulator [Lachnospiraceae bacterium]